MPDAPLSFLPNNPPPKVVFVLGTRPNDTLRPLELLKPHAEYKLRNLSRADFSLILQHRSVQLDETLIDRFYKAMQGNALFLDLVAKELIEQDALSPEEIITQLANNPEKLFTLSIARLKRQTMEWREIIRPLLGILLTAREPLSVRQLRQILDIEDDRLRDGLARLGGLISADGMQRYSLFHLKLYEYLRQDEQVTQKEYLFAKEEEENIHRTLAIWCKKEDLSLIWHDTKGNLSEQERRIYARKHFLSHLYLARDWQNLFEVIDKGEYGKAKVQYDPSMRSYAQDLDLGRQAAIWGGWTTEERIIRLSHLWRYTLLHCTLKSRADYYSLSAFKLLLLMGQESKAIGLAELLTNPVYRAHVLTLLAIHLRIQPDRESESKQIFMRVEQVISKIKVKEEQADALNKLATILTEAQQWKQVERVIEMIENKVQRIKALSDLGLALAQAQQWEQAKRVWNEAESLIEPIDDRYYLLPDDEQDEGLLSLVKALAQAQQWRWAERVIGMIENKVQRIKALSDLGLASAQAQQWEQAKRVWNEAESLIKPIDDRYTRFSDDEQDKGLLSLVKALAQAQQWRWTERVIGMIENKVQRIKALGELGKALANAQKWEKAEQVWSEEEKMIVDNLGKNEQVKKLIELGRIIAQSQRRKRAERVWGEAEKIIGTIEPEEKQAEALSELGVILAQNQQMKWATHVWGEAEGMIMRIGNGRETDERSKALSELGIALAHAQQWKQAKQAIAMVEEGSKRSKAFSELGGALAHAQQWKQAEQAIAMIEERSKRAEALSELGVALAHADEHEQAERVWDKAEQLIRMIKTGWSNRWQNGKAEALQILGISFAKVQQWERAEQIILTIENPQVRVRALQKLGEVLFQFQHSERAKYMWDRTERGIILISSDTERSIAFSELGGALAHAQQGEQAKQLWIKAEQLIEKPKAVRRSDQHVEAIQCLATALAHAQQWRWTEEVINKTGKGQSHAKMLSELGLALAQAQHKDRAEQVWNEAEIMIDSIHEKSRRAEAICELGVYLSRANKYEFLLLLIQTSWLQAETRIDILRLFPLATNFVTLKPEIGISFFEAFYWVDNFFK